ncbi:MAG: glycosyltransferase [Planctomycetota bacterium]
MRSPTVYHVAVLPIILSGIAFLAALSFLAWVAILLHPARPWDFQPVGDDKPIGNSPAANWDGNWPQVSILVPARNEAEALPRTLPALLTQDYPGPFQVVLIDDRSSDGTGEAARRIAGELGRAERLHVIAGAQLPEGWVGKVWALQQGISSLSTQHSELSTFLLLTDADILHAPSSLRRLVGESLAGGLALNSRMARLRCESVAEKLLIPAFVFFFNLLYPMRRVNDPQHRTAAAAGGCMLLSRQGLERIGGGLESIRSELIDDVNLARQVKGAGLPINLSLSRTEVKSLREYPRLGDIWRMVRRSAFTELKYSWLRLAGALLGLGMLFVVPVLAFCGGFITLCFVELIRPVLLALLAFFLGALGLDLMGRAYKPAIAFFGLPERYACTLPVAGVLYGLMTLDSALRHALGAGTQWRETNPKSKKSAA